MLSIRKGYKTGSVHFNMNAKQNEKIITSF